MGHRAAGTGEVVGGVTLLPLPPYEIDLQVGWEITPKAWGNGFATEVGHAVAHYAFDAGLDEIFAVVRPRNVKGAATAPRVGMEWVGVTEEYYNLTLDVYRLRRGDLDMPTLNVSQTTSEEWGRDERPNRRPRLPG
jgi:RimJ/RimL family protein N-acetyltransferase